MSQLDDDFFDYMVEVATRIDRRRLDGEDLATVLLDEGNEDIDLDFISDTPDEFPEGW